MQWLRLVIVLSVVGFSAGTAAWSAQTVDHSLWAQLLERYVHNGKVDYQGFKQDEALLDRYLQVLADTNPEQLARDEQFAFYANAYNAWTVKLILTGYPGVSSIKDLGSLFQSPWKKKIVRINGQLLTLDNLEHDILRPRFKDPRVHFAINCAALSCPPLAPEPFRGATLNEQLERLTRAFINDPHSTWLEGQTLYVSRIFKWFAEDFNDDIIGFVLKYAEADLQRRLAAQQDQIKISYLDYDWSLNGV